jgi:initiation factor 1A
MGKNLIGGNKQKSKRNHVPKQKSVPITEIIPDNKTRFVGQVTKKLGSSRVNVEIFPTNDLYNTLIPGSFRKRIWINIGDYVLIEVSTEITGCNCFIIHKYDQNELDELVSLNHLTLKHNIEDSDNYFTFEQKSEEKEDDFSFEKKSEEEVADFFSKI